jgi:hypothetical protein
LITVAALIDRGIASVPLRIKRGDGCGVASQRMAAIYWEWLLFRIGRELSGEILVCGRR